MRVHASVIRNLIPLLAALGLAACGGGVGLPVANAGQAQTVTTGSFVQLDAGASTDPQGRQLSFKWAFASRPLGSVSQLIDPESAKTSFIADVAGDYTAKVIVSNSVLQSESTVTVTAAACTKPVLATPTFTVGGTSVTTAFKGDRVDLAVAVNTAGNCSKSLSYTWELTPRSGSSASISRQGFPTASLIADAFGGAFNVSVTATDSLGNLSDPVS